MKIERAASICKTQKGTSPSGDKEQPPCHKYLKDTCADPSSDYWHPQARSQRRPQLRREVFFSCIQARVNIRTRNQEENGHPTKLPSRWCAMLKNWDAHLRIFIDSLPENQLRSVLRKAQDPRAQLSNCGILQLLDISSKFGKSMASTSTLFERGSAVREALGHLHTNQRDENFTLWAEEFARCQAWNWAKRLCKISRNILENETTFF